jgi:hypothetical protein
MDRPDLNIIKRDPKLALSRFESYGRTKNIEDGSILDNVICRKCYRF